MEKRSAFSKRVRVEVVSLVHFISECIPRIKSCSRSLGEQCPCPRIKLWEEQVVLHSIFLQLCSFHKSLAEVFSHGREYEGN